MELLTIILLAGLFALWISNRNLAARVDALERHAAPADRATSDMPPTAVESLSQPIAAPPPQPQAIEPPPGEPRLIELADEPETERENERESWGVLFERLVGGRMLIWLGGIALVVAAIFLIRYSIEIGLMTPATRMAGAAAFGLVLLAAGEYARIGRLLADDPRIAQALVGAGIAVLYATSYGSHVLYGLIGTGAASAAMLAITGLALVLSLRHGAPTAVMGLAGGFLTPLLVGDPDAGAVPLLAYLALLDLAIFLVAWRRGWTWLAAAAVALSFVWSAYLLAQPREDALAAGGFIVLLALAAALVRPGEGRSLGLVQPMILGIVQLAILVGRTDLDAPAWILFGALSAGSLALARLRDEYRYVPGAALVLALALLFAKATTAIAPFVPEAAIGITLLFGIGGGVLGWFDRRLLWTALASAALAAPALIVRAGRFELLERPAWGALFALLALASALLVWRNRDKATAAPPADLALLAPAAATALLLGAAVWDLVPADLVAAGWLTVAILAALGARRLGDLALATTALLVALVAVARALWTVPELSTALMASVIGEPALAADMPALPAALQALALPALLVVALRIVIPTLPLGGLRIFYPVAGMLAAAAIYVAFKLGFGLRDLDDFVARGFIERTLITQILFLLGWLLASGRLRPPRVDPDLARTLGTALTALAAARLFWFDLVLHNPAFNPQWVGALPVLNWLLPAFLLSAVWLYAARRRAEAAARSGPWLVAFLAALIAGAMLLVRQYFHGPILTGPDLPIAEFYGYSLAGLLLSIGLLVAGVRLPDKALRLAGLLLLTATMVKVFLVDASELEGVLRILSFLGLGIALIGIGRLYGPVLRAERSD